MKELRPTEVKSLTQADRGSDYRNWNVNTVSLAQEPQIFFVLYLFTHGS